MSLKLKLPLCTGVILGLLCIVQPFPSPVAGTPNSKELCEDCHRDQYDAGLRRRFIHMPFQNKKCRQCHANSEDQVGVAQKHTRAARTVEKIQWLGESLDPAMNHYFLLPDNVVDRTFLIEIGGEDRVIKREKVEIPSLTNIQLVDNDLHAPKISDVELLEVERGIYIEAGIGWRTDEPATSSVKYGVGKLDDQVPESNRLTTEHRVSLTGLKKNQEYRYEVFSKDRFGNVAHSGPFTFSTSSAGYRESAPTHKSIQNNNIKLIHGVTRNDDRVLLNVSANSSVSLSIGAIAQDIRTAGLNVTQAQAKQAVAHPKLKDKRDVNINVCYSCHKKTEGNRSHPVNVRPKRGMIIPREYSTLADGRMTCMSCHDDHASNLEYRLIKSSKKELCIGCHKGMGA